MPQILKASISVVAVLTILAVIIIGIVLLAAYWRTILSFLSIPFAFLFGALGGLGIYVLFRKHVRKLVNMPGDLPSRYKFEKPAHAVIILSLLNVFLTGAILDSTSLLGWVYTWGFEHGFKDSLELLLLTFFCLWPWLLIAPRIWLAIKTENMGKKNLNGN